MEPSIDLTTWFVIILIIGLFAAAIIYLLRRREGSSQQNTAYLNALKYMAEGDSRKAVEQFKEAVKQDSDNIDAYLKLGDILREQHLLKNAIRLHRDLSLRANLKAEEKNKILLSLALDYWENGQMKQAETYFTKLLETKEYKEVAIPYLLRILEKNEHFQEAIKILDSSSFQKEEKYQRKRIRLKMQGALLTEANGDGKQARILLKEVLKTMPDYTLASAFIGASYIKEERPEDALQVWTNFCETFPDKAHLLFPQLEKTYFELGNFAKIQELYERLLKAAPENVYVYLALSGILRKKGDHKTALSLIEDALGLNVDGDLLNRELVRILFEMEQYKKAATKAVDWLHLRADEAALFYVCANCGHKSDTLYLKCPDCGTIQDGL